MATNFANNIALQEAVTRRRPLSFEHRFFIAVAILFPLITVIGFAPSYYFKAFSTRPPLPSTLVHVHGALMSLWIILYCTQTWLVTSKRIKVHMTLGMMSIALVAAMVIAGIATGYAAMARGMALPGFTPTGFFIVPVGDMVTFALLFAAAVYYRKQPANHKRLMLVTTLNFIAPSIARLPFEFAVNPLWFLGVPEVIAIALVAGDAYKNGKVNRVFATGVAFMIASHWLRLAIAQTEIWNRFAASLIG